MFLHPAITDSPYYGHQIAVLRVSATTGVDCKPNFISTVCLLRSEAETFIFSH